MDRIKFLREFLYEIRDYWFHDDNSPVNAGRYNFRLWININFPEIPDQDLDLAGNAN